MPPPHLNASTCRYGTEPDRQCRRQSERQKDKRQNRQTKKEEDTKVAIEVVSPQLCQQVFSWLLAYLK